VGAACNLLCPATLQFLAQLFHQLGHALLANGRPQALFTFEPALAERRIFGLQKVFVADIKRCTRCFGFGCRLGCWAAQAARTATLAQHTRAAKNSPQFGCTTRAQACTRRRKRRRTSCAPGSSRLPRGFCGQRCWRTGLRRQPAPGGRHLLVAAAVVTERCHKLQQSGASSSRASRSGGTVVRERHARGRARRRQRAGAADPPRAAAAPCRPRRRGTCSSRRFCPRTAATLTSITTPGPPAARHPAATRAVTCWASAPAAGAGRAWTGRRRARGRPRATRVPRTSRPSRRPPTSTSSGRQAGRASRMRWLLPGRRAACLRFGISSSSTTSGGGSSGGARSRRYSASRAAGNTLT